VGDVETAEIIDTSEEPYTVYLRKNLLSRMRYLVKEYVAFYGKLPDKICLGEHEWEVFKWVMGMEYVNYRFKNVPVEVEPFLMGIKVGDV
jgi:hypothetical protein